MKLKKLIALLLLSLSIIQVGCSRDKDDGKQNQNSKHENPILEKEKEEKRIMDKFELLIKENRNLNEIIEFINENIEFVSKENASNMVIKLEELQKMKLLKLEDRFYKGEDVQKNIYDIYQDGIDIEKIKDDKLKDLIVETIENGYKIETAEGMYFPIIEYGFYKKYTPYVTDDIKEYIEIMSTQSSKVPAKDAALVISWREVIERALKQEEFIKDYPKSSKIDDIKKLYRKYVVFTFYGLDNTPLFSYDTKVIDENAKDVYMKKVTVESKSELLYNLSSFIDMLKQNDYKLTNEVDEYRENITKEIVGP